MARVPGRLTGRVRDHPAQAEVFAVDRHHDAGLGVTHASDQLIALLDRSA